MATPLATCFAGYSHGSSEEQLLRDTILVLQKRNDDLQHQKRQLEEETQRLTRELSAHAAKEEQRLSLESRCAALEATCTGLRAENAALEKTMRDFLTRLEKAAQAASEARVGESLKQLGQELAVLGESDGADTGGAPIELDCQPGVDAALASLMRKTTGELERATGKLAGAVVAAERQKGELGEEHARMKAKVVEQEAKIIKQAQELTEMRKSETKLQGMNEMRELVVEAAAPSGTKASSSSWIGHSASGTSVASRNEPPVKEVLSSQENSPWRSLPDDYANRQKSPDKGKTSKPTLAAKRLQRNPASQGHLRPCPTRPKGYEQAVVRLRKPNARVVLSRDHSPGRESEASLTPAQGPVSSPRRAPAEAETPADLVLEIHFGGTAKQLPVRRGDDPEAVAMAFAAKEGLSEREATQLQTHCIDVLAALSRNFGAV